MFAASAALACNPTFPRRPARLLRTRIVSGAQPSLPTRVWESYTGALERRPLLTKMATSLICTSVGDAAAQAIGAAPFSVVRLLQLASFSALAGAPASHAWNVWLDASVYPDAPTTAKAIVSKMVATNLTLGPAMTVLFLAFVRIVVDRNPTDVVRFVSERLLPIMRAGCKVDIPLCIVAYRFVPCDLRAILYGVVGIFWTVFVNIMVVNR